MNTSCLPLLSTKSPKTGLKKLPFTSSERELIVALVRDRPIIEDKRTHAQNIELKKKAWEKLTLAYNAQSYVTPRNNIQLKRCWENIKSSRYRCFISRARVCHTCVGKCTCTLSLFAYARERSVSAESPAESVVSSSSRQNYSNNTVSMEGTSKRIKVVRSEGRQIIANVYHFLKEEYEFTELHREPNCDVSHFDGLICKSANSVLCNFRRRQKN